MSVFEGREQEQKLKVSARPKIVALGFSASTWWHFILIGFIGCLFACKYLPRLSITSIPAAAGYFSVFALQFALLSQLAKRSSEGNVLKWFLLAASSIWVAALFIVYQRMDPAALNVDRWSALHNFWHALVNGQYPYQAKSHLNHNISGFPGLFLLAAPFYWVGDVGLMQFAGWIGFAIIARKVFQGTWIPSFLLMLLIGLPAFLYEVECRSDLFTNMVAVVWALYFCSKPSLTNGRRLFLWAIVWGLLLSTRGIVVIPLVLLSAQFLRTRGFWSTLGFGVVVTAVFLATFAPFYVWSPTLFWYHNPFYVQSGNIPIWLLAMVIFICAYLGFKDNAGDFIFRNAAMVLFTTVLVCLGMKVNAAGAGNAIFQNQFDISYFTLSLPFLLISLGKTLERGFIQAESNSR